MAKTVVGLFDDFNEAQNVVQDLVGSGFRREDVSIAANQTAAGYSSDVTDVDTGTGHAVGKDAGIGAGIGGAIGLLVGLGALTIPGIGPVLAAGPLAAAFGVTAGSTVTGVIAGGIVGGLVGALTHIGVPKEHAEYYAEGVRRGGTLVTVNSPDDQAERAMDILNGRGAVDIQERGSSYRNAGYAGYNEAAPVYSADDIARERNLYRTTLTGTDTNLETMRAPDVNGLNEDDTLDSTHTMTGVRGAVGTAERDLPGNRVPGIQTGGHDADGSPDTRGISEKVADAVTGDHIDDKTGQPTR